MEEKVFIWPSDLTKRLFELRFQNDWLFKKMKQPWKEFHKILLEHGFPEEITVDHVRKKWAYHFDAYKLAKRTNKTCNYYKIFDKHYRKVKILDKYESWTDEWRLKLITVMLETKSHNLDYSTLWRTVERAMRSQELPIDCCVQDMKGLWQHLRTTFNRKHRLKLKKGAELSEWPLYDDMLSYFQKIEPNYLLNLETHLAPVFHEMHLKVRKTKKRRDLNRNETESEFQWSQHITESFILIRLQNDWLFRIKKWAWNDILTIMIEEYGFPKTLTSREICRKWASIMSDYQKSKATNKSWLYCNLFELYLGDGSLSLNPIVGWQEEWLLNFISARTDLEHMFKKTLKEQAEGWREVEKRLRRIGLPMDHSLLDLPEIWAHLLKTYRWKLKFAKKGTLTEHWPYFEAMKHYTEMYVKPVKKQKQEVNDDQYDIHDNDDYEDDMKLFDLKQRLQLVKPKYEVVANHCRCCANEGFVNIFDQTDENGCDVAYKLKTIAGIEVEKSDNLPTHICFTCLTELENAYKFRRKCQDTDKQFRTDKTIKIEIPLELKLKNEQSNQANVYETNDNDDTDMQLDTEAIENETKNDEKPKLKRETVRRRKGSKITTDQKVRYHYWKVCEICGKHTRNLASHMDMHSSAKTYSCNVCDKKFKFKAGLIIHKAVHNPTPRKTCEVCGKSFHILAQYRRHFVYHANERKYGCETCGKRFNSVEILKVHSRIHTDERPFSCPECGKTFRTAGCVSRHKRIVHKSIKKVQ
ncbi:hypothetical protein K1T71_009621 [Dendrolimus kikuchii]|uniref:Uncharacterized protein n=1 Tax=Dendrolimus kikuchii TaxID=765133 RepID=A0ACC1CS48_9NEOP|nr:hypothetical protein K1T71_009621 [Dendrolimus kikuchii]